MRFERNFLQSDKKGEGVIGEIVRYLQLLCIVNEILERLKETVILDVYR